MSETKICSHCKLTLPINDFTTRKVKTKKGLKVRVTSICKSCNSYKSKLYYCYKKEYNKNNQRIFLYRFVSKEGCVLYVGKSDDLDRRIHQHIYRRGGLPTECYDRISKIQILEFKSKALRDINEIYYINIFKPPFNKEYNYDEDSIYIEGLGYDEWTDLDIDLLFKNRPSKSIYMSNSNNEYNSSDDNYYKNCYIGKASIFIRNRSNKYFIYAEYFNHVENKKKQLKLFDSDNENIARYELEKIKEKKDKNGNYIIDIKNREILNL